MTYTDAIWLEIQDETDLIERTTQCSHPIARVAATAIVRAAIIEAENEAAQIY